MELSLATTRLRNHLSLALFKGVMLQSSQLSANSQTISLIQRSMGTNQEPLMI